MEKNFDGMKNSIYEKIMSMIDEKNPLAKEHDIASSPRPVFPQCIGPEGDEKGIVFDESDIVISENKEVAGIIIRCGDIVDGIRVLYADGSEGMQHGSTYGGGEHIIRFEPGDTIAVVHGKKGISFGGGTSLAGLLFVTRQGRAYGPFGSRFRDGKAFFLTVPADKTVKGLCGTVAEKGNGGLLSALGLIVG